MDELVENLDAAKAQEKLEKVTSLCKRRGFIFPSAEIYGGFRSTYDYGPLGVQMLRNVKDQWWKPWCSSEMMLSVLMPPF